MAIRSLFLVLASLALLGSLSAVTINAPCGDRQGVSGFDFNAYRGTWYEIYRYPNDMQLESECVSSEIYVQDNEVNMRMYNTMVFLEPEFRIAEMPLTGKFAHPDAVPLQGAFNVSATEVYDTTNYVILHTDYTNYALAWSCEDNGDNTSEQFAWVWSRYFYIPDAVQSQVQSLIDASFERGLLRETFVDDFYCLGGEIEPAL